MQVEHTGVAQGGEEYLEKVRKIMGKRELARRTAEVTRALSDLGCKVHLAMAPATLLFWSCAASAM